MKYLKHISAAIQKQILEEYFQKTPDGVYRWKLTEIAERHEISLSSVNKLIKACKCKSRPRGGRVQLVPNARIMKILRDASQPFITLEEVGELNPRIIMVRGKPKAIPLSRARISKIILTWKKKLGSSMLNSKGFKPGDIIEWAHQRYLVLRYDNSHRGKTLEIANGREWDPFCWIYQGSRSKLIEPNVEELSPEEVLKRYLERNDSGANPKPVDGAAVG